MQKTTHASKEFIFLMAALMATVALSLDAILPALDVIGLAVGTTTAAQNQLLITLFFLGLGIGPLFFAPLSDSLGRKPVVYMGFAIFVLASILCVIAESLELMLLGRILQGISLSGPRTISIAMIRDLYTGDYMARIMSFVSVVFILIPVIAPALGKLMLDWMGWEAIFYMQVFFVVLVCWWFWKRQPETLASQNKTVFKRKVFVSSCIELFNYPKTMLFTLIWGLITGAFLVYLSTAQQIFQEQYHFKEAFPYIFAGLAIMVGISTLLNGTLVLRFGTLKLVRCALLAFTLISFCYVVLFSSGTNPPFVIAMVFFALQFLTVGFLFGNIRSLAMEPVGHIAGMGAAVTGSIATVIGVPISAYIGQYVTTTVLPMFLGFLICGLISLGILGLYYLKKNV